MTKILFLGCDGTIRQPKNGGKFITSPLDQQIIPGADIAIDYHHKLGQIVIGITNQGGVAAGHKSLEDAIAEQRYTLELFPNISHIYFCPDYEGETAWKVEREKEAVYRNTFGSSFRKPHAGMIFLAAKEIIRQHGVEIDFSRSEMVGDRPEDEACAQLAGIRFTPADLWVNCYLAIEKEYKETGNVT